MNFLKNIQHKLRKLSFVGLFFLALFSSSIAATTHAKVDGVAEAIGPFRNENIELGDNFIDISATMNFTISGDIEGLNQNLELNYINDKIEVNNVEDLGDVNPGNGICQASNGMCTLRAAIDESNGRPGLDLIKIPAGNYPLEGQLVIKDNVTITGAGKHDTFIDGQNITEILKVQTAEMLVCDSTNDSVISYDIHGKPNKNFVPPEANGLSDPTAIEIGPDKDLYVTTAQSGVFKYHPSGSFAGMFIAPPPTGSYIVDGAFAPSGSLGNGFYMADYIPIPQGELFRHAENNGANLISTITSDELAQPNKLAFDDYYVYVTDTASNNVQRYYAPSEVLADVFIEQYPAGLDEPSGLLFKDNVLYVANSGTDSILKFNATSGALLGTFITSGSGGLDRPGDISFGPDGDFYVLSYGTDEILRYSSTGVFKDVFIEKDDFYLGYPSCFKWHTGSGSGPVVLINQLTIQNGFADKHSKDTSGLDIQHGALVFLREVVVQNNSSNTEGGGIENRGTLRIYDSEILNNSLPAAGGGATSQGGGIQNSGFLELRRSLVANNFATRGGGISNIGGGFGPGQAHIINSTISNNSSRGAGGGIFNAGSTIAGSAHLYVNHSTITQNEINGPGSSQEPDRLGGGIASIGLTRVYISNSIVAENNDNRSFNHPDFSPDCFTTSPGQFFSEGQNIMGVVNSHCYINSHSNDQIGTNNNQLDPMLGSLLNRVHMPQKSSPAIDQGLSVPEPFKFYTYNCLEGDQNKQSRPQDGDLNGSSRCDIGAAEYMSNGSYEVVEAGFIGDKEGLEIASFGSIELGGFSKKLLEITNNTERQVEVKNLELPDGFETADRFVPFAVKPGEKAELMVVFNPADYGSYKGEMSLMIGERHFQWTLVGEATKPDGR